MLHGYWQLYYFKTGDIYKDIANDVEKWFDTSNCDKNDKRPLRIVWNKKVVGLSLDELGRKIMNLWDLEPKHMYT